MLKKLKIRISIQINLMKIELEMKMNKRKLENLLKIGYLLPTFKFLIQICINKKMIRKIQQVPFQLDVQVLF